MCCSYVSEPAVPALLEARRKQASDHAAAAEAIQEPHHPGVQDSGAGTHQHGRGIVARRNEVFPRLFSLQLYKL